LDARGDGCMDGGEGGRGQCEEVGAEKFVRDARMMRGEERAVRGRDGRKLVG